MSLVCHSMLRDCFHLLVVFLVDKGNRDAVCSTEHIEGIFVVQCNVETFVVDREEPDVFACDNFCFSLIIAR